MPLFIGLMSGTSMDAVDAALVAFTGDKAQLLEFHQLPVPKDLHADSEIPCHCTFAPYPDFRNSLAIFRDFGGP
jgi:1,6-anhydro-N-acetylmuramate kinase